MLPRETSHLTLELDHLELKYKAISTLLLFPKCSCIESFFTQEKVPHSQFCPFYFDANFSVTFADYRFPIPNKPCLGQNGSRSLTDLTA